MSPLITKGASASPAANAVIKIGESRSLAPAQDQVWTKGFAFIPLEMLIVVNQHDADHLHVISDLIRR